jgi:hypothetical protein
MMYIRNQKSLYEVYDDAAACEIGLAASRDSRTPVPEVGLRLILKNV